MITPEKPFPRNARLSARLRATRPFPATRHDADELYRPASRTARAKSPRLARLNELGLLEVRETPGEPLTSLKAHQAILDALYPEDP